MHKNWKRVEKKKAGPNDYLVLVTGSRNWHRLDVMEGILRCLPRSTVIMHGCCRGADLFADRIAYGLDLPVERHPAEKYGDWPECGPKRNFAMLDRGPAEVLAFHEAGLRGSSGTLHCVTHALKRMMPVSVFTYRGLLWALNQMDA